ncbi:tail fiber assembly protein [Salmonella enterica subsp. enterica serovar Typhimurium]|nr:tail fiber assembly protein [Salmonella enterica]MDI4860352.1 tail fiber assembly protein [Salmonella enterica subsp. enterica serovar Muenchen]MDI4878605.1 tail fiber assembly protein [Salmonella enterica subsp. enterica serovar Muenchen]MEA7462344.1 tail fiber assembly protein [Salmonella enterica subsp. enterica serovar Lubbock]
MYLAVRWFYSVMVNLVDTSTAPKIDWPKKPEQPRTL